MIKLQSSAKWNRKATVVFLTVEQLKTKNFQFANKEVVEQLLQLRDAGQFLADKDQLFPMLNNKRIVLFVGLGAAKDLTGTALRISVRRALVSSYVTKVKDIEIVPHSQDKVELVAVVEGIMLGLYSWKKYLSVDPKDSAPQEKDIYLVASQTAICDQAIKICEGVNFARDLVNENADTATSTFIEKKIKEIVKGQKRITIKVLNQKEMEQIGLGLHLAVNRGSPKEPKLIIVKYAGGAAQDPYTAVVGKGITFDTGGLNLKPTGYMETMRTDMSGSAAVAGSLKNIVSLQPKKNLLFVLAIAENAIGSNSYKPGDVFRSYSGKTVEIGNTDAEGRLVLADALAYVIKNYQPARVIDLATLTGACVVALGPDYAGLMTNNDDFAKQLVRSSKATDDRVWRLPVYPEIKDSIKSPIADIKNTGFPKGAAGALTAAEFLRRFVGDTPWAHLDIAGTAYVDGPGRWYYGQGATGFGVRLVTNYLLTN